MIKNIKITNHLGESITFELRFPEKSGFLVRGIDGLGPSKGTINTTQVATYDGSTYNSARVEQRNIVFSLGFLPNATIEDTRQLTYKYFPLKQFLTVQIETDNRISKAFGYVESNEPVIFSEEEGAVISIICPDPWLYSLNTEVTIFAGFLALFEFPFSNESLTEKLIEFGEIETHVENHITYTGDVEVGMVIYIHATGAATNLTIINPVTRATMHLDSTRLVALTGADISTGDDIIISTVKGDKYVILLRSGVIHNILNVLDKNTDWFVLEKGDNVLSFTADSGATNLHFRVENLIAYEGI